MKQMQFEYRDADSFRRELKKLSQWCRSMMHSDVVFDIYAQTMTFDRVSEVIGLIREEIPEALYRGCSTNGNIFEGRMADTPISIACTIYEYPDTRVKLIQLRMDSDTEKNTVQELKDYISQNSWVKAVEMLARFTGLFDETSSVDELRELFDEFGAEDRNETD